MIMADINTMRFCTSLQSFNDTTKEILEKWSCLVWSNRVRKESFNRVFKAAYTNNERVTMGRVCDIMCTCVNPLH